MQAKYIPLFLTIYLLPLSLVEAKHIIGGIFTYEYVGNSRYKFRLTIYRDCLPGDEQKADFDAPAHIAIYRCGQNRSCSALDASNTFEDFQVFLEQKIDIPIPDFPCLEEPDNVCVEEGIYEFETTLPPSDESYHLVYQRCCRNETIANIPDPGDAGATYTIEITPEAQALNNNSPTFKAFPPTVICANEPLLFDHSAIDTDGDSLVYEFCSPLLGGANYFGTQINTCSGVQPTPPCPPPFEKVEFIAPTYSFSSPMGGEPAIRINRFTGEITGTPTVQGQFVVGVCVKEYRGGQLIGEIFRDFQFNVMPCEPTVVAGIRADSVIDGRSYLVSSCGASTLTFENESFERRFVDDYRWTFDIKGEERTYREWDASVTFPDTGRYQGQLIINPGLVCSDTANIFVNIFPDINADFEYEYDTCVAGPVQFTDLSRTGSERLTRWQWYMGDGGTRTNQNPNYLYQTPGEKPVTLSVTDINRCETDTTIVIPYYPVPPTIVLAPPRTEACQFTDVFFNNLSTPIDSTYDIVWDFGDGTMGEGVNPTHSYEEEGTYDVSLDITSPIGCQIDTVFPNLISILAAPIANFTYRPQEVTTVSPDVTFDNRSLNAFGYQWNFGDAGVSTLAEPSFTFRDTGTYEIQLIAFHPSGCRDTTVQYISLIPIIKYFLPNAFTPNEDDINDVYKGIGITSGVRDFRFTIWNRWGELVFETDNPDEGWNGRQFNTGKMSPNGVYICLVTYLDFEDKPFEHKGFVTLLK